jgi:ParB/RepB/Spo0J family partition protein
MRSSTQARSSGKKTTEGRPNPKSNSGPAAYNSDRPQIDENTLFKIEHEGEVIEVTLDDLKMVSLDAIAPMPEQPRRYFDKEELENMALGIKTGHEEGDGIGGSGIYQPILVRRNPTAKKGGPRYFIIAGERRWRSSQIAGLKAIPAVVRDMNNGKAYEAAVIENVTRVGLNPLEEGLSVKALMNMYKLSQRGVAIRLGQTKGWVERRLAVLKCGEDVQRMVVNRHDTISSAMEIDKVTEPHLRASLIEKAMDGMPYARVKQRVDAYIAERRGDVMVSNVNDDPPDTGDEAEEPTLYGRPAPSGIASVPRFDLAAALDVAIRQIGSARDAAQGTPPSKQNFNTRIKPKIKELREMIDQLEAMASSK